MKAPVSLVFGATGNVGWGVAHALLDAGHTVVAPTRSAKRADALAADFAHDRLHPVVGDPSTEAGAAALRDAVAAIGPVQHVVASMGPWWQKGPVIEQPEAEYRAVMASLLDCQVFAARALLPDLLDRSGASYTLITGRGGQMSIPGTGLLVIAVCGVYALSRMLRTEHAADAVRVNEILIGCRIERRAGAPGVVAAADFGAAARAVVEGDVRGQVLAFDRAGDLMTG